MTITIPAREFQKGDIIDFGGQPITISEVGSPIDGQRRVYFHADGSRIGWLRLLVDSVYEVERPEPIDLDADIIKALAELLCVWDSGNSLAAQRDPAIFESYCDAARELLTTIRTAQK